MKSLRRCFWHWFCDKNWVPRWGVWLIKLGWMVDIWVLNYRTYCMDSENVYMSTIKFINKSSTGFLTRVMSSDLCRDRETVEWDLRLSRSFIVIHYFQARLKGILHHVTNVHEWALGDGWGPAECEHGDLPEQHDKGWIEPGSQPHDALAKVIMDTRFMNTLKYYVNFR